MKENNINNPYSVITGASSGLGEEFARQLAQQGNNLILAARRTDKLNKLKAELLKISDIDIITVYCDLNSSKGVEDILSVIKNKKLDINFLVNNAGFGYHDFLELKNADYWDSMINVNVSQPVRLLREIIPFMIQYGSGNIINVASIAGFMPLPGFAVYASAKSFLLQFSVAMNIELKKHDIHVTALCPGPVPTEFGEIAHTKYEKIPRFVQTTPSYVVAKSLSAVNKNKQVCIPGTINKITTLLPRVIPRKWLSLISYKVMK